MVLFLSSIFLPLLRQHLRINQISVDAKSADNYNKNIGVCLDNYELESVFKKKIICDIMFWNRLYTYLLNLAHNTFY